MDMTKYASTKPQVQEIIKESPHSVKLSINAKGLWSGECKAYGETPHIAYLRALKLANNIEEVIKNKNK